MFNFLKNNFNFQFAISYLGVFPFIFVLCDIIIFNIYNLNLLKDFIFFYILIIFTFIGASRWSFVNKSNNFEVLAGFLPSLISTILIIFYLLGHPIKYMLLITIILLTIQLIVDYIFSKFNLSENFFFINIRFPITLIIIFNICYLISV